MKAKKVIVKVQETSRRTIEFDCEIDVPLNLLNSKNKELLDEFVQEKIEERESNRYRFIDIVESELLDTEVMGIRKGKLPQKINSEYKVEI